MTALRWAMRKLTDRARRALARFGRLDDVDATEAASELLATRRAAHEQQRAWAAAEALAHGLHEAAFRTTPDKPLFQQLRGEA